ncbi:MAG TPA: TolC family outer membrane protein [Stellaceae bacterium]|nr:TolC family outer membrane protein [Stellaceae bacterium]
MRLPSAALLVLGVCGGFASAARAETLTEALTEAYQYNPQILAQRAHLRATDEGVPQALSGWRPTVQFTGSAGSAIISGHPVVPGTDDPDQSLTPRSLDLNLTQPVYTGGRVGALRDEAEHNVQADRARTQLIEEQVLFSVAQAYLDVVRDQATVDLNINNEQVLRRQLEATNDQFRVGEVTRTDVAQAESRLALATADRVQAEGNLRSSRANYERAVGHPPGKLSAPTEQPILPATLDEGIAISVQNNPNVVVALYTQKAGEDNVRAIRDQLLPQIAVVGDLNRQIETQVASRETSEASLIARMTVPLYEGGNIYSQTRQAKQSVSQFRSQVLDAQQAATQSVTRDWQTIQALRARVRSLGSTISAAAIALEGVRQESQVGSRTILDVLNAEQELFTDRVTLVQAQHDLAIAEYDLTQQIGRLTAQDLKLPTEYYDVDTHYKAVHDKWIGFGAKDQ